jgi:tRNA-dihydrouridine synthase A
MFVKYNNIQAGQFGAVLMKSPQHVHTILQTVDDRRRTVPFTIKCRIGVDQLDSDAYFEQFVSIPFYRTYYIND